MIKRIESGAPRIGGESPMSDFAHMPPIMSPAMLSAALPETAEKTLQKWRTLGVGPEWSKDAGTGKIYYLRSGVIAWMRGNSRTTTENEKPGAVTPGQNTKPLGRD